MHVVQVYYNVINVPNEAALQTAAQSSSTYNALQGGLSSNGDEGIAVHLPPAALRDARVGDNAHKSAATFCRCAAPNGEARWP